MNCILVVIDSLDYTRCQQSEIDLLPNLNRRAKNGIKCESIYSQAPYTEAATMALYCGQNTLDNHGYIERYNNADAVLMEVLQKAGYETYFNSLQPQCFPTSLRRGIDHVFYNRGYDIESLWNYRFKYYSDKAIKKGLTATDYQQLIRILDDNFKDWQRFLKDLIADDVSVKIIKNLNKKYDPESNLAAINCETKKYQSDHKLYIDQLIETGQEHPLFNIPYFSQIDYDISKDTEELYSGECKKLCRRIRKINFIENILFNEDISKGLWKAFKSYLKNHNKDELDTKLYIIKNALIMCNLMKKYGKQAHSLKGQPSFYTHIHALLSWIDERKEEKPYFACIHVDDIHYPEMFYTYDVDEYSVVKSEIDLAYKYLKKRRFHSKGTISLDLSLLYADAKCEYLFQELEKRNMTDDSIILVTADHGFSYSGYPIRNKLINTFYLENFKIPFYIFAKNLKEAQFDSLHSSIDIPPTICDLLGIDIPESFKGESVISTELPEKILTLEYCGGGCPDINDRELMIAAFDKSFLVASMVRLEDEFVNDHITEIYNLEKDPYQRRNLVKTMDFQLVDPYVKVIKQRIIEIKRTNTIFMEERLTK